MTYRNKKLLEVVRKLPCQICGIENGTIVAAHSNQQRDGKGTGIKAQDYRIAALCNKCTWDLIKAEPCQKQKEWNSGKMHIEEQLENYLNTDF